MHTRWRQREPGAAVKHWVKRNAIKMYDKAGRVLRIETVINDPKEFFVHRPRLKNDGREVVGWFAMNKGVANLYRYAQVSQRANERYLEALSVVNDPGVGQRDLDRRSRRYLFKGGGVAVCSRFLVTIRPCFAPCCGVNTPCAAFAMVRWPNGCTVHRPRTPGNGAGDPDK